MRRFLSRLTRAGAFISKEIAEVRRQPRLILSLILGPFLILLLFGIGYVGESGKLNAIILVPNSQEYSHNAADYYKMMGNGVSINEVTSNKAEALDRLRAHTVDVVIGLPENASQQISNGSQAIMTVYFNEVDPLRRDYLTSLVYLSTNELNKQTLAAVASRGQASAGDLHSALQRMRTSLSAVETKIGQNDQSGANAQVQSIKSDSLGVQLGVLLLSQVLSTDTTVSKPLPATDPNRVNLAKGQAVTTRLNTDLAELDQELQKPNPDRAQVKTKVGNVRQDLDELDTLTQQFQKINPLVLAAPFYAAVDNTAPIQVSFTSFYAPSVVALLIQHIAITLAALSMVRERLLGTLELFRVSPVSPGEVMAGKYISFTIFLGLVTAVLLLLTSNNLHIAGFPISLGVPILGSWSLLVITLAFLIFASVGLGFFIASISKTESQAVQIAMIVLLASVFFSGFFLRPEVFWIPVRFLSYLLPVTYGINSMQVIMLRGGIPNPVLLVAFLFLGTFFGLLGFIRFSREYKRG